MYKLRGRIPAPRTAQKSARMGLVPLSFDLHLCLAMLRLWPADQDMLTPRAEKNPFEVVARHRPSTPGTPTGVHPLLAAAPASPFLPPSAYGGSAPPDLTPSATSAPPTTHLSIHAPVFKMQQPPLGKKSAQSVPTTAPNAALSKGQLHLKLIQARGLNVRSIHAKPYAVVQFEQNEFVSRDPISETDKEVKGTPTTLSRQASSNAISALGAIGSKAAAFDARRKNSKGSKESSPSSSLISAASKALLPTSNSGLSNGLLGGRLSAHNPVWKHEVTLYVASLPLLPLLMAFPAMSPLRILLSP